MGMPVQYWNGRYAGRLPMPNGGLPRSALLAFVLWA